MSIFQTVISLKINENPLKMNGLEDEISRLKKTNGPGNPGIDRSNFQGVKNIDMGSTQKDFQRFYLDVHGSDRN